MVLECLCVSIVALLCCYDYNSAFLPGVSDLAATLMALPLIGSGLHSLRSLRPRALNLSTPCLSMNIIPFHLHNVQLADNLQVTDCFDVDLTVVCFSQTRQLHTLPNTLTHWFILWKRHSVWWVWLTVQPIGLLNWHIGLVAAHWPGRRCSSCLY